MTPAELTPQGFAEALREQLESEIQVYPARAWYPSSLGHPCDRAAVWRFTRWDQQERHSATLQSIFDQGKAYQPLIYARLEAMGFEVIRESDRPREWRLRNGARISGRIDGKLLGFRGHRYPRPLLLEAKTMAGHQYDRTETLDDLRNSSSAWTRAYYAQGMVYCLLEELEAGVFVIYSKATGLLKLLPFELDYGFVEAIISRPERLQPMIHAGEDPEPIPYDGKVCGGCGFRGLCYPPRSFGEGASVIDDPDLVEMIELREKLRPASHEFDELDRAVKSRLKHEGIASAVCGPFVIEGQKVQRKAYSVQAGEYVRYDIRRAIRDADEKKGEE